MSGDRVLRSHAKLGRPLYSAVKKVVKPKKRARIVSKPYQKVNESPKTFLNADGYPNYRELLLGDRPEIDERNFTLEISKNERNAVLFETRLSSRQNEPANSMNSSLNNQNRGTICSDILHDVFCLLPRNDLDRLLLVNRQFHNIIENSFSSTPPYRQLDTLAIQIGESNWVAIQNDITDWDFEVFPLQGFLPYLVDKASVAKEVQLNLFQDSEVENLQVLEYIKHLWSDSTLVINYYPLGNAAQENNRHLFTPIEDISTANIDHINQLIERLSSSCVMKCKILGLNLPRVIYFSVVKSYALDRLCEIFLLDIKAQQIKEEHMPDFINLLNTTEAKQLVFEPTAVLICGFDTTVEKWCISVHFASAESPHPYNIGIKSYFNRHLKPVCESTERNTLTNEKLDVRVIRKVNNDMIYEVKRSVVQ
uniref:F-box domain-containing protein n=1 Tax=Ditylenchus dipsaci TaxID=166011 RepID=A0A915CYX5_9BILA